MANGYVFATAVAPGEANGIELIDGRKDYTMYGEIMLLVLVIMFAFFIISLLLCLYLRHLRRLRQSDEEEEAAKDCNLQMPKLNFKPHVGSVMYTGL